MKGLPLLRFSCSALLLLLPACESSPTAEDDNGNDAQPGTFSATVTGHVSATVSGVAAATGGASTGGWGIVLAPGGPQSITIVTPGRDRPPAGTYPIVVSVQAIGATSTVFFASFVAAPASSSYTSTEGTLTIQSSSATRVVGSFSFEAMRGTVGNPEIVNVQGTFNATNTTPAGM
jgi:hypothetical protein